MHKTYLKCPKLEIGATIGIVAPSAPTHPDVLPRVKTGLNDLGFKVQCPDDPSRFYDKADNLFSSDSVENRVKTFNALIEDDDVSVIWSIRGGHGSIEILDQIDFRTLRHKPKFLIGYSDFTNVLLACLSQAEAVSIHAPALISLFQEEDTTEIKLSREMTFDFLMGKNLQPFSSSNFEVINQSDSVEGILLGGNLTTLCSLVGTNYLPHMGNSILFLEDIDEKPQAVHRMLSQLKISGLLSSIKAVILGNFSNCVSKNNKGPSIDDVFTDIFYGSEILVVKGAPFGHCGVNFPLPLGIKARLDLNSLELLDSPVL